MKFHLPLYSDFLRRLYTSLLISTLLFTSTAPVFGALNSELPTDVQVVQTKYSYKIITAAEGTFGYEILQNNKVLIRQLTIPAAAGKKGFANKQDAEKVAELVISKLNKGEMPPSVTLQELEKLKVRLK